MFCLWIVLSGVATASRSHADTAPHYPLKLSSDGKYIVDQENRPFFINGDTAWSLIAQLSQSEAEIYLSDRARKGFNLIVVNLIEHKFAANAPANQAGQAPFNVPGDFSSPNEQYFAHADWIIKKAAEKNITVLLAPLYLGYQCGNEGWCSEVKKSSLASIRNYGRYLGKRYKDFGNIIWLVGGDADPQAHGVAQNLRELVAGIQEFDKNHMFTAHNAREQSAADVWPNEPWLTINNVYTQSEAYRVAIAQFDRPGSKPLFLIEGVYENEHNSTPSGLRRQAYWTILSGGVAGHIFGNCPIWHFNAPSGSGFCGGRSWRSHLDSEGSITLSHIGRLFGSRAFYSLLPDRSHTVLTDGFHSGANLAVAARASDGSTIIAYIPTGRTVTIDLSQVTGPTARVWWFNPRTAATVSIGTYSADGPRLFRTPDAEDWVVVVDSAVFDIWPAGKPAKTRSPR
jgi:hypothetical protein